MILSSYKTEFNSSIKYFIFQLIKKLGNYKNIQLFILNLFIKISPDNKFISLFLYINKINYIDINMNINALNINEDDKFTNKNLDIYDIFNIDYKRKIKSKTHIQKIKLTNITYIIEKSGFFSTIFTIIIISFYCNKNNINLHINFKNWSYNFNVSKFFNIINEGTNFAIERGQGDLFIAAREYINMLDDDSEILNEYFSYRYGILKQIYNWSKKGKLDSLLFENPNLHSVTTCFIRRGDKLLHEGYPLTINDYKKTLSQYDNVVVIGDDYYFNERLSKKSNFKHIYIQDYKPKGAYLNKISSDSVNAILLNFCILVDSKFIIGDPYCNLFAAALILRGENFSKDKILHPWKLRNFI